MNSLERHVLELIGEDPDSPDVFTEGSDSMDQIRGSLNDAIEEVSMLTGSVKRTYHMPLRASRGFQKIPSVQGQLAWITDVWLMGNGRRLEQVDFTWLQFYNPRWLQNSGPPERYCLIGVDVIGIHPVPTSGGDMLEFTAAVVPDRYQNDDERVQVRENFKWATVHYAVSEYYASRGDAKSATEHILKYVERVGLAKLYPETNDRHWEYKSEKWNGQNTKAV